MNRFIDRFKLLHEKENHNTVIENIENGVAFRGTNLWVLIFAIFIASLGLNVNSTAVIIGAMLISPLMGPIMGLGLGIGINDLSLLKRSLSNYLFAVGVGLAASTLYFLVTPLNDAHSELLARTYPTIYDVLIAFFGGLAGMVANSSKLKGNVIPGVAIATALMPPLCTAGYGLATLHWEYFFGAAYLFMINSVFIATATLITVRLLKIPRKKMQDEKEEKRERRIVAIILTVTLLPSLYLGYDIVRQDRFEKNAKRFIENECILPNDYLLNKTIDPKAKSIHLTYGGKGISAYEIKFIKSKLKNYNLDSTALTIDQGFSYLTEMSATTSQISELSKTLQSKVTEIDYLKSRLDSIKNKNSIGKQLFREVQVQYPTVESLIYDETADVFDETKTEAKVPVALLKFKKNSTLPDRLSILNWMKVRLNNDSLKVIFQN